MTDIETLEERVVTALGTAPDGMTMLAVAHAISSTSHPSVAGAAVALDRLCDRGQVERQDAGDMGVYRLIADAPEAMKH